METSYKKLWKLLIDKDIKKGDLCKIANISPSSLAKLNKGESVTTSLLMKICIVLECDIGDIVEVVKEVNQ